MTVSILTMFVCVISAQPASAAPGDSTFQTFTSSGTFTVPTGVTSVDVLVVGAGGSGGAGSSQDPGGGGGGAMVKYVSGVTVTSGAAISVTVGAASGGSSSFAADSAVTAAGGSAGGDAVGCVQGLGGDGYTGTSYSPGFNFDPACYLIGGYGGGSTTTNSITGSDVQYGGGGGGGIGYGRGDNGAGSYGYGGGGGGLSIAGNSGGGGVVIVRWIVPNDQKAISAFSFTTPQATGTVDTANHGVAITVPYATDVTALVATFTLSSSATASVQGTPQVSGTTANDFTTPLTYVVTAQDGTTQNWTVTVTVAPDVPVVTSVNPGSGPVVGGISVYVDGTNLSGATSVKFGTTSATITSNTSTRVTVTLPAGFGTKDVSVTTAGGTSTLANAFTYASPTITSITPSSGPIAGGTSVYVDGTNLTNATGVTFAGLAGTITNTTDTRVTVLTPAITVGGPADVVLTASGPESVTSSSGFTYASTAPGAPTIGAATAGDGSASVTFTAPARNGGATISGYTVTSSPGNITANGAGSPITVTGLTNGTAYTFSVIATNNVGPSLASSASAAVTPRASGGGGGTDGGDSGGSGSAGPTPMTQPPPATLAPTTTPPSSQATATPVVRTQPTVPGLTLPTRILVPGRTVIMPRTLYTSDGARVTARVTLSRMSMRSMPTPPKTSSLGARVVRYRNGAIAVVTTGRIPVTVTLRLSAPATATNTALAQTKTWRVPASRR